MRQTIGQSNIICIISILIDFICVRISEYLYDVCCMGSYGPSFVHSGSNM